MRAWIVAAAIGATSCAAPPRVGLPCARPVSFQPFDAPRPVAPAAPPPRGALDGALAWYQAHGRAPTLPGGGCPFAPSCSSFARRAVQRYGAAGLLLILDRLIVREHVVAPAYYPITCVDGRTRLADDLP